MTKIHLQYFFLSDLITAKQKTSSRSPDHKCAFLHRVMKVHFTVWSPLEEYASNLIRDPEDEEEALCDARGRLVWIPHLGLPPPKTLQSPLQEPFARRPRYAPGKGCGSSARGGPAKWLRIFLCGWKSPHCAFFILLHVLFPDGVLDAENLLQRRRLDGQPPCWLASRASYELPHVLEDGIFDLSEVGMSSWSCNLYMSWYDFAGMISPAQVLLRTRRATPTSQMPMTTTPSKSTLCLYPILPVLLAAVPLNFFKTLHHLQVHPDHYNILMWMMLGGLLN